MDRDASFHAAFRLLLEQSGVRVVRTPPSSPNCNAYIERFHRSFKTEVAERMIFLGEAHLRRAVDEYLVYYHRERNHQGLEGEIIDPECEASFNQGKILRRERLGGDVAPNVRAMSSISPSGIKVSLLRSSLRIFTQAT